MKRKKRKSLYISTILMTVVPLLVLGLFAMFYCEESIRKVVYSEAEEVLKKDCAMLLTMYDTLYPGDYSLQEGNREHLLKGGQVIDRDFTLVDELREKTQVDFTIFYYDTRKITTITEKDGLRSVGTKLGKETVESVCEEQQTVFYKNTNIRGQSYFASYSPIYNQDGTCVGIVFAGKPTGEVTEVMRKLMVPMLCVIAFAVIAVGLICVKFTVGLVNAISKTEEFLSDVSEGNLTETLEDGILQREDEIGHMGRAAVRMQNSLRELIERDVLTGLYNRRHGTQLFKKIREEETKRGEIFSVAMCDIDYFKQVNDTYGHECGDRVLRALSEILSQNMADKGYSIRWGGEEFLLIFENLMKDEAAKEAEKILEDIHKLEIAYGRRTVKITMTIGIAESSPEEMGEETIRRADQNLYRGKMQGRDRIVV